MKLKQIFGCSPSSKKSSKNNSSRLNTYKRDYEYQPSSNNGTGTNGYSSNTLPGPCSSSSANNSSSFPRNYSSNHLNVAGGSGRSYNNYQTLASPSSYGYDYDDESANERYNNYNYDDYNHPQPQHHQRHQGRTISHSLSDSSGGGVTTSSSSGGSGDSRASSHCSLRIGDRIVWFRDSNYDTGGRSLEFGTVRWIGFIQDEDIAGIEFDKPLGLGSGWYKNQQLFQCQPHHGGLVAVAGLLLEEDYTNLNHSPSSSEELVVPPVTTSAATTSNNSNNSLISVSSNNTTNMPHASPPWIQAPLSQDDCDRMNGRQKGIQGHRNSCYLDATLFSMFSFSSVFDSILIPPLPSSLSSSNNSSSPMTNGAAASASRSHDVELEYRVRQILRENIVNPLRKDLFTPACNVMKLREIMKHLDDKIISEEMDPQEFLQILFHQVLHLPEFLSLSLGQDDYFHQVLVQASPSDVDKKRIPTVQSLLEQSFMGQKLKFKNIPNPALILQMPRSGNKYRTYDGILPNLTIDITDLLQDTPRMCTICGSFATYECPDCYGIFSTATSPSSPSSSSQNYSNNIPSGLLSDSTSFCAHCIKLVHSKKDRSEHPNITKIEFTNFDPSYYFPDQNTSPTKQSRFLPSIFGSSGPPTSSAIPHRIPRITMDLFAVICIETSHFVSFVKCGPGREAPWVFFDSMADRIESSYDGTGQGHNIPNVKHLPKMGVWLDKFEREPGGLFLETLDNVTPELKRLITDSYICLYYSPQSSMYS